MHAELASKPDQPESAVNDQNFNIVWVVILQENQWMACEEKGASTNILKTSIEHSISFYITIYTFVMFVAEEFLISLLQNKCKQEITNAVNENRCFKMIWIFLKTKKWRNLNDFQVFVLIFRLLKKCDRPNLLLRS